MCSPVRCMTCGKTTWAGCGAHIEQVKARVPAANWCDGKHTAEEIAANQDKQDKGFFARIFR